MGTEMENNILEIAKLRCGYRNGFHIEDVSFSIRKGSFVGIIGPNGSGKTTIFKSITGILHPEKGSVVLNGKNTQKLSIREKAREIAIVSQDIDAGFILVEDYVLMGRIPYHSQLQFFETAEDYEKAEKYMRLTDSYHHKDKFMNELSGGEQQLAAIARALTQEPCLLLLDEPTSHLDITHQVQLLNLLQRLNHDLGLTVIMVIHDLNLAGEYCDQLILLKQGKIHSIGTPEKVLDYKTIEEVYNTVVVVEKNPISGNPYILLVSEKEIQKNQNLFGIRN